MCVTLSERIQNTTKNTQNTSIVSIRCDRQRGVYVKSSWSTNWFEWQTVVDHRCSTTESFMRERKMCFVCFLCFLVHFSLSRFVFLAHRNTKKENIPRKSYQLKSLSKNIFFEILKIITWGSLYRLVYYVIANIKDQNEMKMGNSHSERFRVMWKAGSCASRFHIPKSIFLDYRGRNVFCF